VGGHQRKQDRERKKARAYGVGGELWIGRQRNVLNTPHLSNERGKKGDDSGKRGRGEKGGFYECLGGRTSTETKRWCRQRGRGGGEGISNACIKIKAETIW